MLLSSFKGFTLVELIVVITIVGILSTVGFVSYSGYLTGARDSNRFSQLTKLSDSLQVYAATKSLPLPDDYIEITASGSIVAYQGYVGVDVLETIDYTNGGKDPKDSSYYTYYISKDRKHMQLLAMMEEQSSVSLNVQTFSADYTERVPKVYGKKLGILTETSTNTPVQEVSGVTAIDVFSNSLGLDAHISDNHTVSATGARLISGTMSVVSGKSHTSCKNILSHQSLTQGVNGTYFITLGEDEVKVYCDMETDGGGWTLFYANNGRTDSVIKKSYITMRTEVLAGKTYPLYEYDKDVLAGLLDFRKFTDTGAKELLITNRISTTNQWGNLIFSSKNALEWSLQLDFGGSLICNSLITGEHWSLRTESGMTPYVNLSQVMVYNGIGVSHTTVPCNSYPLGASGYEHVAFYSGNRSEDEFRVRSSQIVGGTWGGENQYRYFLR